MQCYLVLYIVCPLSFFCPVHSVLQSPGVKKCVLEKGSEQCFVFTCTDIDQHIQCAAQSATHFILHHVQHKMYIVCCVFGAAASTSTLLAS